ncbi:hypothetical protein LCGC14_3079520, partial [marine sediment metagenome]
MSVEDTTGEATLSAARVMVPAVFRIEDTGLTDYGDFWHDGASFQTNFVNTASWIIRGTGIVDLDDSTIIANKLQVNSTTPGLVLNETDAAADAKQWTFVAGSNIGWWGTQTDVGAFGEYVIKATRTGAAVNTITILGDTIELNPSGSVDIQTALTATSAIVSGDWKFDAQIIIKERATAPVGESAYGVIWVKNTIPNELWFTNDASQDFMLVSDLISDTTPQLGGNLASNGFDILMADGDKVIFGDGGDMQMYNVTGTGTSKI